MAKPRVNLKSISRQEIDQSEFMPMVFMTFFISVTPSSFAKPNLPSLQYSFSSEFVRINLLNSIKPSV